MDAFSLILKSIPYVRFQFETILGEIMANARRDRFKIDSKIRRL